MMGNAGRVARMEKMRTSCKVIGRKPVRNRPICRPKRKGEDNIKLNLKERRNDGVCWVHVASNTDCWGDVSKRAVNLQIETRHGEL